MKKFGKNILKILSCLIGFGLFLGGIGGIIVCFYAKNIFTIILCVIFSLLFLLGGIFLLRIGIRKTGVEKTLKKTRERQDFNSYQENQPTIIEKKMDASNSEKRPIAHVETENMIQCADEKPITNEEIPYLIQLGYEKVILAEQNSKNTIGHTFSNYMGMKIVSNTYPPIDGYDYLNENEKLFFQEFYRQLTNAKLLPSLIKLTRLSNGGFNVDYVTLCYIGKINLYKTPASYLVIKKGNKRATKKFRTLQEAEEYISQKEGYNIEVNQPKETNSMQYLRGASTIKNLSNLSVEQCIEYIPYWIRYIKYCKRN